jgi:4-amino-4-deoxy-L-arabinose transferase-like glycosyltransferase
LTAGPWYGLVAADTRGKWIETFIMKENIGRFSTPQENHRGNPLFHPLLFVVLFAPWSIFLGVTFWNAIREARKPATDMLRPAYRLLLIWFAVVLVVFSIAATKLPNYILPLYPATAIMTACALERWRSQVDHWPRYIVWGVALGWGLVGLVTVLGILIAAGTLTLPIKGVTPMPALAPWAGLGGILVVSAVAFAATVRRCRTRALVSLVVGSVGFLAGIAAFPTVAMNAYKAPRPLVEEFHLRNPTTEFRLGGFHWLRESAVFYAQREIVRLDSAKAANEFLELDIPSYVFVPAKRWEEQRPFVTVPCEVLGRHYDMYARDDILILANPPGVALFRQHGP